MNKRFLYLPVFFLLFVMLLTINACHIDRVNGKSEFKLIEEKSFNIEAGKTLKVDGYAGDISIDSWDKNEVSVKIFGNKKAAKNIDFKFDNSEEFVEVIADKHGSFFNWFSGISLKFEIKVPRQFNNQIKTSGGDIRLADVEGRNQLKTSGGDVLTAQVIGDLQISTSGGDIIVKRIKGNARISTSGGDIKTEEFFGDLEATTSGGDIFINGNDGEITAKTSGGDIFLEYTGENRGINLITSGGDIRVKVPENFNANANLYSSGGDVECNLKTGSVDKITSSKFEAEINNGGKDFNVKTSGGDIVVSKK